MLFPFKPSHSGMYTCKSPGSVVDGTINRFKLYPCEVILLIRASLPTVRIEVASMIDLQDLLCICDLISRIRISWEPMEWDVVPGLTIFSAGRLSTFHSQNKINSKRSQRRKLLLT